MGRTRNREATPEDFKALKGRRDDEGKGVCFTYLRNGSCSMEKACKYSHTIAFTKEERGRLVAHLDKSRSQSPNPKAGKLVCRHWQEGKCWFAADQCPYLHEKGGKGK